MNGACVMTSKNEQISSSIMSRRIQKSFGLSDSMSDNIHYVVIDMFAPFPDNHLKFCKMPPAPEIGTLSNTGRHHDLN